MAALAARGRRTREAAIARLHALLLRAARFEVARRRPTLPHLRGNELDDIANEAADDALMSVLRRLDDFRGASRFTTWAYKFALLEAAVKLRKRAWQGREVPLEPEGVGACLELEPRARRRSRAERAPRHGAERDRRGAHTAPAKRPRRARAERRPDRRSRRTPEHEPRRALQDVARRPAKAPQTPGRARPRARRLAGGEMTNGPIRSRRWDGFSDRRSRKSAATSASRSSTATSSSSSPARMPTPRCPGCAPTSTAAPPAARNTRASTPSSPASDRASGRGEGRRLRPRGRKTMRRPRPDRAPRAAAKSATTVRALPSMISVSTSTPASTAMPNGTVERVRGARRISRLRRAGRNGAPQMLDGSSAHVDEEQRSIRTPAQARSPPLAASPARGRAARPHTQSSSSSAASCSSRSSTRLPADHRARHRAAGPFARGGDHTLPSAWSPFEDANGCGAR